MTRRVTVMAAGVDLAFVFLFLAFGSPLLAWLNVVSITMYAVAYWLLGRRINGPAVVLIWIEVLGHAAIGTLLIGWDSGFHYYLLMFIPAIVVAPAPGWCPTCCWCCCLCSTPGCTPSRCTWARWRP